MNIDQLMSRSVKTCSPSDSLESAARIMWENDCGIVPVLDAEGRAVGMITDRDICMAGFTQGKLFSQIPVSNAMSKTVYAVHPGDAPQAAEDLMRAHQVRRVAVTEDGGRLVGLLSLNDLARHSGGRTDDLTRDEIAKTLAAICLPAPAVSHAA